MSEQIDLTDYADSDSEGDSEWVEKRLGEIFESIYSGGTPKKGVNEYYGGDIPFVKIEDLNEQQGGGVTTAENSITEQALEETSTRAFDAGTLLMTIYGSLAETALVQSRVATNQGILGLWDADDDNVLYVRYAIDNSQPKLASLSRQTTQANLGKGIVKKHKIPVPPLPEQRKIATVLYTIDRAIEKTGEIIEQTKRIKSGLLQSLLTEGYYEHNEWRTVDSQDAYLMSRGSKLPAEWDICESDEIAKIKMGHTPDTSVEEYWNGDIPWIDIHDMTKLDGTKIHTTDDSITKQGLENSGAKLLPKGTVVLCRTGDIGRSAILGKTMATHQQLVSFECDETKLRPHYLTYVFRYASSQLKRFSVGSTHKQIQLHFFSDLKIPLPSIDEQDKIVGVLKQVDKSIEVQKKKINQLRKLKKVLMQDLLSGTVRTTDTNIEVPEEIAQYG